MNLLMRRREMMLAAGALPEWDYEWDYTMGAPDANGEWTKTVSGTASSALISTGLQVKASASSSVYFSKSSAATNLGVMEIGFNIPATTKTSVPLLNLRFGNSTDCLEITFYRSGQGNLTVKRRNEITFANGTTIGSFQTDVDNVLRLVLNGNHSQIILNDNILSQNFTLDAYNKGAPRFGIQNASGASAIYHYVKMKIGRLS